MLVWISRMASALVLGFALLAAAALTLARVLPPPELDVIAFTGGGELGAAAIFLLDVSHGLLVPLTEPGFYDSPRWSPDGEHLAYHDSSGQIMVYSFHPPQLRHLSQPSSYDRLPQWDGDAILFRTLRGSTLGVYRIALGGGTPQRISTPQTAHLMQVLSPDGTRYAATDYVNGAYELFVLDAAQAASDTAQPRQITQGSGALIHAPVWSPDSARLLFMSNQRGLDYISSVDVASGAVTHLRNVYAYNAYPAYSPDMRAITYWIIEGSQQTSLYRMDADGANAVRLATFAHNIREPVWRP